MKNPFLLIFNKLFACNKTKVQVLTPKQKIEKDFDQFLCNVFKMYFTLDSTVASMHVKENADGQYYSEMDRYLDEYYENNKDAISIKDTLMFQVALERMIEIGNSAQGVKYSKDAMTSISSVAGKMYEQYAVVNYQANVVATVLCKLFYYGTCDTPALVEVYSYCKENNINVVALFCVLYGVYKRKMHPTYINNYCNYVFTPEVPGTYNKELLQLLDQLESIPESLYKTYERLRESPQSLYNSVYSVIQTKPGNRYSCYKGLSSPMEDSLPWQHLELLLFITAFNNRLPMPIAFLENAVNNPLVILHLGYLRKLYLDLTSNGATN